MIAKAFITALSKFKTEKELNKVDKFFKGDDGRTKALGVKFGDVFKTAKAFSGMPPDEIAILLESDYYEVRMGAVSMMDFQVRERATTDERKKKLFELYLSCHNKLNNWDFVDRAAPRVIGEYLLDKPREILYKLARSKDPWERRTAIVSTHAFIKKGELDDTFAIAEILIDDDHEYVNKAVGSWIREASKQDKYRLIQFLDRHAPIMPAVTLRYATEKLDKKTRDYYLKLIIK